MAAISASSRTEMSERPEASEASIACKLPRRLGHRQIGWRDQHAEALAPDDHALVSLQVHPGGNGVALASLERAQAAEIDEHGIAEIAVAANACLWNEVDVKCR